MVTIKSLFERRLPRLSAWYRLRRDRKLAASWQKTVTPMGIEMIGRPGMGESRVESGELQLLRNLLESTDVFVDAGANCGLFTLVARAAGVPSIAIEPNIENLNALLTNLQHNELTDVEVFPIALSRTPDVLPLFGGGEGASLERNWGGMLSTYSRMVPVNTLDNIVGNRFPNQRLLIKVDVEGHEYDVLQGASHLLGRTPAPRWFLEHGFRENFAGEINPHFHQLFQLFWQNGYRCVTADEAQRPVTEADVQRWLAHGQRDFGFLNYLMIKEPVQDGVAD